MEKSVTERFDRFLDECVFPVGLAGDTEIECIDVSPEGVPFIQASPHWDPDAKTYKGVPVCATRAEARSLMVIFRRSQRQKRILDGVYAIKVSARIPEQIWEDRKLGEWPQHLRGPISGTFVIEPLDD